MVDRGGPCRLRSAEAVRGGHERTQAPDRVLCFVEYRRGFEEGPATSPESASQVGDESFRVLSDEGSD